MLFSIIINSSEHVKSVLIGDHAFVGTFHLVHENDVNVGSAALFEAGWESHS